MSEDFVYFGAISLLKILILKVIIYIPFRLFRSFILECFLDFSGISGISVFLFLIFLIRNDIIYCNLPVECIFVVGTFLIIFYFFLSFFFSFLVYLC